MNVKYFDMVLPQFDLYVHIPSAAHTAAVRRLDQSSAAQTRLS